MTRPGLALVARAGFVALALLGWAAPARGDAASDGWKLRSQKHGVTVHTRRAAGSAIDEFRGVAEVDAGLRAAFALLTDVETHPRWIADCSEARSLELRGIERGRAYQVTDLPWPLHDRDVVVRWQAAQAPDLAITVTVTGEANGAPLHEGRVRVKRLEGLWKLEPVSAARTRVTYQLFVDPSGNIPAAIANAWVVSMPFETLRQMNKELRAHPELGRDARYAAIREPGHSP